MTKSSKHHPYLIGITGGSASGKSYLIKALRELVSEKVLAIISQDDYYKSIELQKKDSSGMYNFDLPEAIDHEYFHRDLIKLCKGETVQKTEYTFNHPEKVPALRIFNPAPVIIAEGLFLFCYLPTFKMFDLTIFIDCDEKTCFQRRMERDRQERGIPAETIIYQWENHVKPAFDNYVLKFKDQANLVIHNNNDFNEQISILADFILNMAELKR